MSSDSYRSGFAAVVGRPNTGKSTLVNALVAEKISIVTAKPQTTRHSILGILTRPDCQIALVDTPGLHKPRGRLLNRAMNRAAAASLGGADLALFVIEATGWRAGDDFALSRLEESRIPVLLVVNKMDLVKPRSALLPFLEECGRKGDFREIVPVSARRGDNLDHLLTVICNYLPAGPSLFPDDMRTDRSREFRVAEVVREKLLENLREEVPYGLAVEVLAFEERGDLWLADVVIWVERESHQGIVVGRGGETLKRIGRAARLELEAIFGRRLHLETRVKLKANWSDNAAALRQLGYEEPS
jgi:GTP-binding protein Era